LNIVSEFVASFPPTESPDLYVTEITGERIRKPLQNAQATTTASTDDLISEEKDLEITKFYRE